MAHRLCNFNLSEEKYLKEKDTIVQIGQINGYQRTDILKIIRKHENIRRRQELTTLIETRQPTKKRISVPFFPAITNKLKKVFTRNNLEIVATSGEYKLKNMLMSTKDKKDPIQKSGIYEIKCGTQNCGYKYIGQTRRSIKTRYKEHKSHTTNNHHELSSVANHMNNKLNGGIRRCPHNFEISNLKLLKTVPQQQKLDAYESIFLYKARSQRLMNDERQKQGNIVSPLYKLLD
jgi:hypothetical protein